MAKLLALVCVGTMKRCRVFHTPMGRYRRAWPHGTHFTRRVITDSKDEIELRCAGLGKFLPTLTAQPVYRQTHALQRCKGQWMHGAFRVTARRIGCEPSAAEVMHYHLGHDGAGGVARA